MRCCFSLGPTLTWCALLLEALSRVGSQLLVLPPDFYDSELPAWDNDKVLTGRQPQLVSVVAGDAQFWRFSCDGLPGDAIITLDTLSLNADPLLLLSLDGDKLPSPKDSGFGSSSFERWRDGGRGLHYVKAKGVGPQGGLVGILNEAHFSGQELEGILKLNCSFAVAFDPLFWDPMMSTANCPPGLTASLDPGHSLPCSGKGSCSIGSECECDEGFEGAACEHTRVDVVTSGASRHRFNVSRGHYHFVRVLVPSDFLGGYLRVEVVANESLVVLVKDGLPPSTSDFDLSNFDDWLLRRNHTELNFRVEPTLREDDVRPLPDDWLSAPDLPGLEPSLVIGPFSGTIGALPGLEALPPGILPPSSGQFPPLLEPTASVEWPDAVPRDTRPPFPNLGSLGPNFPRRALEEDLNIRNMLPPVPSLADSVPLTCPLSLGPAPPPEVQDWCCSSAQAYGVKPGQSWGALNGSAKRRWRGVGCDEVVGGETLKGCSATAVTVLDAPAKVSTLPPWWITQGVRPDGPAKDMGSWTAASFSPEQQERYGIDAEGNVVDGAAFKAATGSQPPRPTDMDEGREKSLGRCSGEILWQCSQDCKDCTRCNPSMPSDLCAGSACDACTASTCASALSSCAEEVDCDGSLAKRCDAECAMCSACLRSGDSGCGHCGCCSGCIPVFIKCNTVASRPPPRERFIYAAVYGGHDTEDVVSGQAQSAEGFVSVQLVSDPEHLKADIGQTWIGDLYNPFHDLATLVQEPELYPDGEHFVYDARLELGVPLRLTPRLYKDRLTLVHLHSARALPEVPVAELEVLLVLYNPLAAPGIRFLVSARRSPRTLFDFDTIREPAHDGFVHIEIRGEAAWIALFGVGTGGSVEIGVELQSRGQQPSAAPTMREQLPSSASAVGGGEAIPIPSVAGGGQASTTAPAWSGLEPSATSGWRLGDGIVGGSATPGGPIAASVTTTTIGAAVTASGAAPEHRLTWQRVQEYSLFFLLVLCAFAFVKALLKRSRAPTGGVVGSYDQMAALTQDDSLPFFMSQEFDRDFEDMHVNRGSRGRFGDEGI